MSAVFIARHSPTIQAETLCDSFTGFGQVPFFTRRQSVGALNGKGAGVSGLFGLCTNCASRMNALSARASNEGMIDADLCAGMVDATSVLEALSFVAM